MHTQDPIRSKPSADQHFGISAKSGNGMVRLRAGNQWLHWSGGFLTDKREHAWTGTIEQAANCRRDFDAAAGCKTVEG
jgi:hypothetical protein